MRMVGRVRVLMLKGARACVLKGPRMSVCAEGPAHERLRHASVAKVAALGV